MTIHDAFEKEGAWLFSRRSYIPLVLLPFMTAVILFSYDYPQMFAITFTWDIVCLLVTMIGMSIRAFTIGTTPAGTSGRNTHGQVAESLNTQGIYSIVRHPLYVGNFFVIIGISMLIGVWWFVVLVVVLYWFYYERIIFTEEEYLCSKFGDRFLLWAEETHAVIPSFKRYKRSLLPFSLRTVLGREYSGFLAISASFAIVDLIEYFLGYRNPQFTLFWTWVFIATFVIAFILRIFRKKTRLLSVDGR